MASSLFGRDYDSVSVGGSRALPAGGYICRILKARMIQSSDGRPMVEALFDICEGEYSNYFTDKHRENMKNKPDAEYPRGGRAKVIAINEDGTTKRSFKGFVTSIERSNDINLPREDGAFLKALEGKLIGVIMGREQFQGSNGNLYWTTKPRWYRSVEDIEKGNYDTPDDTYLTQDNGYGSFNDDPFMGFSQTTEDIPWQR